MAHFTRGLFILIVLGGLVGPVQAAARPLAAPANTIIVNQQSDVLVASKCRLRDAIEAANTNTAVFGCAAGASGPDVILFNLSFFCVSMQCSLVLDSALPTVTEALTIDGGQFHFQISGQDKYQVFDLGAVTVNLSHLRIVHGKADTGGGIRTSGTLLTVDHVVFADNTAVKGAAIGQGNGTVFIYNSVFTGNSARFGGAFRQVGGSATLSNTTFSANTAETGGAIGVYSLANLHVIHSSFDSNSASFGGAIDMQGLGSLDQATITASTFTNNQALTTTAGLGGGALSLNKANLTLTDSTLANNISQSEAGGLGLVGGQATLTNVTLSANAARRDGGAIRVADDSVDDPATLNLNNVTISLNTADTDNNNFGNGGGLAAPSGTINVQNSIIAGNFDTPNNSGSGTLHRDCSATLASPTNNLLGRLEGCAGIVDGSAGNHVGSAGSPLNPQLGPLADNGGPTLTHALLFASLAISAGSPLAPGSGGPACAAADQRGVARPFGARCDAGAFEAAVRLFLPLLRR